MKKLLPLLVSLVFSYSANSQNYPSGFSQVLVASNISNPTVMAFAPDGRIFVAQQNGQLRIIKNGSLLATPFISLSVNSSGERGLLGIAFDPAFNTNQYIYLYYTLSSGSHNRISRFTANGDVVVPGSEVVLLNLDPLSSATNHNGGTMQFGADGKLYVGIGENANTSHSQNLDTYHGKVLRINPDGSVPSGNPFTTGSAQRTRVWSYGLRNPYTLAVQPGTGKIFVNDVGQNTWEEINEASTGGLNFGWPSAEGNSSNPSFTNPVYVYQHGSGVGNGCAITGGTFFNPVNTNYPSSYNGRYFFMDYCNNWIDMLTLSNGTWTRSNFASNISGLSLGITTGTDGNLYYLSRSNSAVYRIQYSGGSAPVITSHPQSTTVNAGASVTFSVTASGTAPLSYQWRKNGSNISGATSSTYTINNVNTSHNGSYSVQVSNTAGNVISNSATLTVNSGNQPPVASINTPAAGALYTAGTNISYSGTATDPEQGNLPASAYQWYVMFHHDTHTHPGPSANSGVTSGSFHIPNTGETSANVFYRLYLVITDAGGLTDTAYTDILPRKSTLTISSNPPGLKIKLDGQPFITPLTFESVEGVIRNLNLNPSQHTDNALVYEFSNWSDGGAAEHDIVTPVNNTTYTANYNVKYKKAMSASGLVQGLHYSYFTGNWNTLPVFNNLSPVSTGTVTNFSLAPRTQNDNFGFRFTGYISIPADGIYKFYTSSDDGSKLYIGNSLVVKNDGLHSLEEKSGSIALKAGLHPLVVDFFEQGGGEQLEVRYEGPSIAKQLIPNSVLFRSNNSFLSVQKVNADAMVRSGSYSDDNYGTDTRLGVRNISNTDYYKESFLRFRISHFDNPVQSAVLRLYGQRTSATGNAQMEVQRATGNWTESSITFNNKPSVTGAVINGVQISSSSGDYYEFNVTSLVTAAKNSGASNITLRLRASNANSASIIFWSDEKSPYKPELIVQAAALSPRFADYDTEISEINVYPNPSTGNFCIDVIDPEMKTEQIEIYSLSGALIYKEKFNPGIQYCNDGLNLNSGLYNIVLTGNKILTTRLMIE